MKIVLDTNTYCDFAEGLDNIVDIIATRSKEIFIPSPVIGELHYGFRKGNRFEFNDRKLRQIIDLLKIQIIGVDISVARKYGAIFLELVKKGRKIPINDVWVAACCMEVGGTLLTRDGHFNDVDQIDKMII
jgi:tRNA(fMet)-specific endonuclease VapC